MEFGGKFLRLQIGFIALCCAQPIFGAGKCGLALRAVELTAPSIPTQRVVRDYTKASGDFVGRALIAMAHHSDRENALAKVREDETPLYLVSPKHVRGTHQFRSNRNNATLPDNHVDLYRSAIASKDGNYWAVDENGNFHRFAFSNGIVHWNGATSFKHRNPSRTVTTPNNPDPIAWNRIPKEIRDLIR